MPEPTIDIPSLLAPLSDESPCGQELDRSDARGGYYRVKSLRDEALASEEAYERAEVGELSEDEREALPAPADWRGVINAVCETFTSESKDFRLACWLGEALLREHGHQGVHDALALCRGICEQHWETVYPRPNEDGHLDAVAPMSGLVGQTAARLLRLRPITPGAGGSAFSVWDYKQASGGKGSVTLADIQSDAGEAPDGYFADMLEAISGALESIKWLSDFLDQNCLPDSYDEPTHPAFATLREELEDAQRVVKALAGDGDADDEATEGTTDGGGQAGQPSVATPTGVISSRSDALKVLGKVAEYFERTEPHSPISYALRQTMSWGRMSLPELLRELISNRDVREDLQKRVGVPLEEDESY